MHEILTYKTEKKILSANIYYMKKKLVRKLEVLYKEIKMQY